MSSDLVAEGFNRLTTDQFADALTASAELAFANTEGVEETVSPGGVPLRIRFAGRHLRDQMMRAFAHVQTPGGVDECLTVTVWDSSSSGVPVPPQAGLPSDHWRKGFGQLKVRGHVLSLYDEDGGLTLLDARRRTAINWLPDARRLTERQRAAPLQAVLSWWLPLQGRAVVHAAALGIASGAVLLAGNSHAGKSTTALACLDDGFSFLGDDLCALTVEDAVRAHSVYCSAKVFEHNLERFESFAAVIANPGTLATEKAIGYVPEWRPAQVETSMPLRAVVVLTAKGLPEPSLKPISPMQALLGVAPSTLFNLPGSGKEELSGLAAILARVPCYEMSLAADLSANPRLLRQLLDERREGGSDGS